MMTLPSIKVTVENSDGGKLPLQHASRDAGGADIPPSLTWEPWPEAASYAVTCYDPDAPTGSGIWHWIVTDIPTTNHALTQHTPATKAHINDLGVSGYTGAAPPPGPPHRYQFTVWALDVDTLPIPEGATNAVCRFFIHQHAVAAGTHTLTFGVDK